ncbi:MAG: hypothetical protein V1659_03020 [Candidatus Woesearchaeota archaeon]
MDKKIIMFLGIALLLMPMVLAANLLRFTATTADDHVTSEWLVCEQQIPCHDNYECCAGFTGFSNDRCDKGFSDYSQAESPLGFCCGEGEYWDGEECNSQPEEFACKESMSDDFLWFDDSQWFRYFDTYEIYDTTVENEARIFGTKEDMHEPYGGDTMQSRSYIGNEDSTFVKFKWKMKLNNDVSTAVFKLKDTEGNDVISVGKGENFLGTGLYSPLFIYEEPDDLICFNLDPGIPCCENCIFNAESEYDEYTLIIDVINRKYKVLANNEDYDNEAWRDYGGETLTSLIPAFYGDAIPDIDLDIVFDEFNASGGYCSPPECPDGALLKMQCNPTNLPEPADAPACSSGEEEVCCADSHSCVLINEALDAPKCVPTEANQADTDDSESLGLNLDLTCEYDADTDSGVWCPVNFQLKNGVCVPQYSTCDYGFADNLSYNCSNLTFGPADYNLDCLFTEPEPWEQGCCLFSEYNSYQFYQIQDVIVYNPK